jgi:hypothetical protein
MKKIVMMMLVAIISVGSVTACHYCTRWFNETEIYSLTTVVVDVDYDNDIVTCEDFNGNHWDFFGCEDWIEGDIASMVMYKNGTWFIYDDEIIAVNYCGWFDGWGDFF